LAWLWGHRELAVNSRKLFWATQVFVVLLTLVIIFILGPEIFQQRGNYWIGAGLVLLVLAVPIVTYLCRPSVRRELPVVYDLWRGIRAMNRSDHAAAEKHLLQAIARADTVGTGRGLALTMALSHLGTLYRTQGRLADAESVFIEMLKQLGEANAAKPTEEASALLNLAAIYITQGRFVDGETRCHEALAVLENDTAPQDEYRAVALLNLGQVLVSRAEVDEAETITRRALGLLARQIERAEPNGCQALASLADVYCRQGRLSEAEPLARRALALAEKARLGARYYGLARLLNVLAEIVRLQGRLEEAETLCARSQVLTEEAFGSEHINLESCLATMARIRIAQARYLEAEQFLKQSLAILERVVLPEHHERAARLEEYVVFLGHMNRPSEAEQWQFKLRDNRQEKG
jgi:tetratricopeptide (TPR) repeat protein